ncbi:MAG: hypothetical protein GY753_06185 [Gammaproteobacteria bacterium]|nr:hypothetical protein [Gammaproteobacteria bacterium]
MSLTHQITLLSNWEFWALTIASAVVALIGLYLVVRYLRLVRTIEDTPTAKIRSAHQGYVELAGMAVKMEGEPILAPLTGRECCWYRYKVERHGDKHWHTIEKGSSEHLFLLQDDTGECIIDPDGADVTPEHTDVWHGNRSTPSTRTGNTTVPGRFWKLAKILGQHTTIGSRYRYTESRIHHQDPLYAIGLFKSLDEMDHMQQRKEITRELLRDWKQDQAGLRLEFDRNRDGHIDAAEWEQVRHKAARQAQTEQQQLMGENQLHTLSATGSHQHPFLLSSLPEFDLVRRYRLFITLAATAFFVGGILSVWLLSFKLV